jgi:hypothetical protein
MAFSQVSKARLLGFLRFKSQNARSSVGKLLASLASARSQGFDWSTMPVGTCCQCKKAAGTGLHSARLFSKILVFKSFFILNIDLDCNASSLLFKLHGRYFLSISFRSIQICVSLPFQIWLI